MQWTKTCVNKSLQSMGTLMYAITTVGYKSYENALNFLEMETLDDRREGLCLEFAKKCLKNKKIKKYFPENNKEHQMVTRYEEE